LGGHPTDKKSNTAKALAKETGVSARLPQAVIFNPPAAASPPRSMRAELRRRAA
jgi:hypothetical protein